MFRRCKDTDNINKVFHHSLLFPILLFILAKNVLTLVNKVQDSLLIISVFRNAEASEIHYFASPLHRIAKQLTATGGANKQLLTLNSKSMKTKFYYCPKCGNVILKTVDSGVTPSCCGETMVELTPNTADGKTEYHVPVTKLLTPCSLKVCVGKEPHPMTKEHNIRFIYAETECSGQIKYLCPGEATEVIFSLTEYPKAVYAYCNLHGLWKTDLAGCVDKCKKE